MVGQRVALPRRVARLYPAYGLYLYGEGLYAQETRALKLAGAPVLFLPGNAGSFKQGTCVKSMIEIMSGLKNQRVNCQPGLGGNGCLLSLEAGWSIQRKLFSFMCSLSLSFYHLLLNK